MRFTASVLAASTSIPEAVTSTLGANGGRQSTCVAGTPWACTLWANDHRPTFTTCNGIPKND